MANGKPKRSPSSSATPEASTHRRWKYALVQHPMWLLIAEDSVCAERTPPWGCPTIEEYAKRLVVSLDAVERFEKVHINFDFSGVELEDLRGRWPDIADRLRKLTSEGRISFVNGTYSQPHLHILSLESIIRQFEFGLRAIEEVTGYKVTCYASQEPGFSQLLPQILRAFGYKTATTPGFPFGLRIIEGFLQHWSREWSWTHGDDVVDWVARDGTTIPVWLRSFGRPNETTIADDIQRGLLHRTRLRVDLPDMVEVDQAWVDGVLQYSDIVKLDQALEELSTRGEILTRVEFDPNYAYVEGVDAEELSRANTRVEASLLRLERVAAFLPVEVPEFAFEESWRTLLAAQHHDAYWTGAPELRAKCINRLKQLGSEIDAAAANLVRSLGHKLPPTQEGSQALLIVSAGHEPCCRVVEIDLPSEDLMPADESAAGIFQKRRMDDGSVRAAVACPVVGVGYSALLLRRGPGGFVRRAAFPQNAHIGNKSVDVRVQADGRVLLLRTENRCLLVGEGNKWYYVDGGREVVPEPIQGERFSERGSVCEAAQTVCDLGGVRVKTRITLLKGEDVMLIDTEFDFPEPREIGDYFDDTTKLQAAWNVGDDAIVRYVCGGCVETARRGKTFVAYPVVDVSRKYGSITFRFDCATKCWLDEDGMLHFIAAWGHNGDRFHNRQGPLPGIMGPLSWLKPMDLRLKGKYVLRQTVFINRQMPTESEILRIATGEAAEPIAVLAETGGGELPWSDTLYKGHAHPFVTLSARKTEAGIILRVLNAGSEKETFRLGKSERWQAEWARTLDGKRISLGAVPPWKVVEILLAPKRQETWIS